MCLGAFFSLEEGSTTVEGADPNDGPAWIVGDTFLKNVYSIFRYENPRAVGFARLSDVAKGLSNHTNLQTVNQVTDVSAAAYAVSVGPALAWASICMAVVVSAIATMLC